MPYKNADRHRRYNAAQMKRRRAKEALDRNEIASYIADLEALIPPGRRPDRPELEVITWAWTAEQHMTETEMRVETDVCEREIGMEDYA